MKQTKFRLFALLLAIVMVLALVPVATFAEENGSGVPVPNGYIPVELPGSRTVTDAYLRGDMETYRRLTGTNAIPHDILPETYDSRDNNYVTSVKDQNPYGSCWAHAAVASIESYMIKHGVTVGSTGSVATTSLNLSETQHCFFNYTSAYDAEGMLTGDKTTLTGGDNCLNAGGNGEMSAYTLQRWTGAASESVSALAYSQAGTVASSGLNSQYAYGSNICHVQNSVWIPGGDIEGIKRAIMEYGAGNISYHETGRAYTYIYTKSSSDTPNHAITLVGWDDTISRTRFPYGSRPAKDGAWICKNSWGTSQFDGGYCYISYEDASVLSDYIFFYDAEPIDNYDHNYQYDGTCNVACYGKGYSSSTQWYVGFANNTQVANVFTANGSEDLKAIAFCNWDEALTYTVDIYKNPTAGNPSSGTRVSGASGYLTYSGYYTVPLDTVVRLNAGDTFSVVITQSCPTADDNGAYIHTPYDATFNNSNYADWVNWTHKNHGNTSYYKEPDGSWTDCPDNGDYRIKAYTVDAPSHEHSYGAWTTNNNGTHSRTCSSCSDVQTENCTYTDVVTPPTVTEQGYTTHTCTVCGYSFVDSYTDPLGYTVSFSVPAGVTAPAPVNCPPNGTVALPTADAPEGYTFLGWVTDDYSNVAELPATVYTGEYAATADITLKALYSHTEINGDGFALLTAAPESWEGSYVVTCGNTDALYALKGLAGTKKYESATAGGAVAYAETGMTLSGTTLNGVSADYIFRIEANGDKFTVKNAATGTYLASRGGYLYSYRADAASYCRWTFAMNETAADATNAASRTMPHLGFSTKNYFMVNRSASDSIFFWKLAGSGETTTYTTVIG